MIGVALGVEAGGSYRIKWVPITDVILMLLYLFGESQIEMKKKSASPPGCRKSMQENVSVAA